MLSIRTLLVPVDFSEGSDRAARWATDLAARFGASVTLLHVVELPRGLDPASLVHPGGSDTIPMVPIGEWAKDSAERRIARMARTLRFQGITVDYVIAEGAPVKTILAAADERRPDAIVMGTHGRTGLAHAFMGSVAERVVRAAPCPVITLRSDGADAQPTTAMSQADAELAG